MSLKKGPKFFNRVGEGGNRSFAVRKKKKQLRWRDKSFRSIKKRGSRLIYLNSKGKKTTKQFEKIDEQPAAD